MHGSAASQVRAVAAARIGNAADEMVQRLLTWAEDPDVEVREKVRIAQDLLDRTGLNATGKWLVGGREVDPVEALFRNILNDPNGLAPAQPVQPAPDPVFDGYNRAALEAYGGEEDIVDAEVVEEPDDPHTVHVTESMSSRPPAPIRKALEKLL